MTTTVAAKSVPELREPPLIGTMRDFQRDRLGVFRRVAQECGEAGRIHFGPFPLYIFSSPEVAQAILVEHPQDFDKGLAIHRAFAPVAGNGLFNNEGEDWRQQRKLMAPALTARHVASYADTMVSYAGQAQSCWREGETVSIDREMMALTMSIVGKTLFDADVLEETDELGAAVTVALEHLQYSISHILPQPVSWPLPRSRRTREAVAVIDRRIKAMIDERRSSGAERNDLLSLLLAARDETGAGMSDKQIRDEAVTLFLAGHETTANTLSWSWYLLAQHPEIYARLRQEAHDVLGGRPATAADLPRLPFALQVFKETLRLYPTADSLSRTALRDVNVAGYQLHKNDIVAITIYNMHRRPDFYPDPERFDPDRFTPENEKKLPRHAFMPFGAGPRICIGNHFAMMEGQLILATLAQHVTFEMVPGQSVEPAAVFAIRQNPGAKLIVHRS